MPGEPAAHLQLEPAELEVALVVHDEHLAGLELVEARRAADGAARLVHERLRLEQRDLVAVEPDLRELAGELRLPRAAVPARELVEHEVPDVVAVARVFAAGIAEADDEQIERRPLTAGPQPHRGLALGGALVAGGLGRSSPSPSASAPSAASPSPASIASASAASAASASSASMARVGAVSVATTVSGSSRNVTPSWTLMSPMRSVSPVAMFDTSRSMCSGTSSGSASTWISRSGCESTPPSLTPGALLGADQVHGDGSGDRLVEADLVQVDVDDVALDLVDLVVLEDRRVGAGAVDLDVENRVQAGGAGERPAELTLLDRERDRLVTPVEHAGDEPLAAQTARFARAEVLALLDDQLCPLSSHTGA